MPTTDPAPARPDAPPSDVAFRRSLRASLARRRAAFHRRRRVLRGRRGLVLALTGLAVASGGAVAATTGGATAGPAVAPEGAARTAAVPALSIVVVQRVVGVRADGIVGPRTRAAIRRFQRRAGLRPTGRLDARTRRALRSRAATVRTAPPAPAPARAPRTNRTLETIAACESGGDPAAVSANGLYRGKYQFARATWAALGGKGDPAEAPEAEQDLRAGLLLEREGSGAWPSCAP